MNNRNLVVAMIVGLVVLASAFVINNFMRPRPAPALVSAKPELVPAPPVAKESPRPEAPPPGPSFEPAARAARKAPSAKPDAAAAPAAPPEPATADASVLRIDSDVPGAQVFIDREYLGTTPLSVSNPKPGTHRLNVSAAGYEGVSDTIEITSGPRDVIVKLKEVRLNVKLDVVHKHRIGSCKGRLVATARGLRYETTEKDDAFSAGLLDLETFEVDYLAKNLRVKSKNGKRFDFTDPDGNADRLFVFHRDVDKARERLKKGDTPAE